MYDYEERPSRKDLYRNDKKMVATLRCVHAVILFLLLASPVIYGFIEIAGRPAEQPLPKLQVVSDEASILEEYEYLELCECEVTMTFNQSVSSGTASVSFYDKNNQLIETETMRLYPETSDSKIVKGTVSVDGIVNSYKIQSYQFEPYTEPKSDSFETIGDYMGVSAAILIVLLLPWPPIFPLWIRNFTCNCKEYVVGSHHILVYAGIGYFCIKSDGKKYDEVSRFALPYIGKPTVLQTTLETGEVLSATVSPTFKVIRLKVDNRLVSTD